VEDQILHLLRQRAAQGLDQGLQVTQIAQHLDADSDDVLKALQALEAKGLAYKESFWWYPGRGRDFVADIDQA
jgi:predicted ArsR family transcriptional regulator